MDDVLNVLFQIAFWGGGACWFYVDRVRKIDARRVESYFAWLTRPLKDPPPRTDWVVFDRRVEEELRAAAERADRDDTEAVLAGLRLDRS